MASQSAGIMLLEESNIVSIENTNFTKFKSIYSAGIYGTRFSNITIINCSFIDFTDERDNYNIYGAILYLDNGNNASLQRIKIDNAGGLFYLNHDNVLNISKLKAKNINSYY